MKKKSIAILSTLVGAVIGVSTANHFKGKHVKQKEEKVDKFKSYYNMLNQWMLLKNEGKSLEEYFEKYGYKSIAIYGMGEMGNRLYEELKSSQVEVKYAIDKKAEKTLSELKVVSLEDSLEPVDAIVVTAVFAFKDIEQELRGVLDSPVISLEDIVFEF